MTSFGSSFVGSEEVIALETVVACGMPDTEYCICWWLYSFAVCLDFLYRFARQLLEPALQSLSAENGQTTQLLADSADANMAQTLEEATLGIFRLRSY